MTKRWGNLKFEIDMISLFMAIILVVLMLIGGVNNILQYDQQFSQ